MVVGDAIKDVLIFAGISDVWIKVKGATDTNLNFVRAAIDALGKTTKMKASDAIEKKADAEWRFSPEFFSSEKEAAEGKIPEDFSAEGGFSQTFSKKVSQSEKGSAESEKAEAEGKIPQDFIGKQQLSDASQTKGLQGLPAGKKAAAEGKISPGFLPKGKKAEEGMG